MAWWKRWIDRVRAAVRRWLGIVLPRPAAPVVLRTEVRTVLRYTFGLPPEPGIDDFDHREVEVTVNGSPAAGSPLKLPKGSGTTCQFDFDRNVSVSIDLVDVDTTGNKSKPSEPLAFTATDTVPPDQPGAVTIAKVEQV